MDTAEVENTTTNLIFLLYQKSKRFVVGEGCREARKEGAFPVVTTGKSS